MSEYSPLVSYHRFYFVGYGNRLAVGSALVLRNLEDIASFDAIYLLDKNSQEVAKKELPETLEVEINRFSFPGSDKQGMGTFSIVIRTIANQLQQKKKVLLCCRGGDDISLITAAAILTQLKAHKTFANSLERVMTKRNIKELNWDFAKKVQEICNVS